LDENSKLNETSDNFRWSAAVAAFGMLLKDSDYKGDFSYDGIIKLAKMAKGEDEHGYRVEFIRLMEAGQLLARR
ncbi:MAG: YfbK domain-containing protein, partial [Bacteroidota bacterium]